MRYLFYCLEKAAILFLVLVTVSCTRPADSLNDKEDTTMEAYHIDLPDKIEDKFCKASSFADTVVYVTLETTKASLLGDIRLIAMDESHIVVSDKKRILVFDQDGKFITQIGQPGSGPGEFSLIFNFVLKGDTLFISSFGKNGIDKYGIDGTYLRFIEQKFRMFHFCAIEDGYAWYDWMYGHVVYFDENWKVTDTLLVEHHVSKNRQNYGAVSTDDIYLNKTNGNLLFYNYLTDTVWDITTKEKQPAIVFNLNEKLLPETLFPENYHDYDAWKEKSSQYLRVNFMQTDSFTFILQRPWARSLSSFFVYSRKTSDIKKYELSVIYDDISGHRPVIIWTCIDNSIIAVLNYGSLQDGYNKADSPTVKKFWAQLLENVKENDNQVLAIFKVK